MKKYNDKFIEILSSNTEQVEVEEIFSAFNVGENTVKKYLKAFINQNPSYLTRLVGFYPAPETIISLVESDIGLITSAKLWQANQASKLIVDAITKPKHAKFLSNLLSQDSTEDFFNEALRLRLADRIYEEYAPFVREADNGLISMAGGLNEKLFLRALENQGLVKGRDFVKTGTDSDGDLVVFENFGSKRRLTVEIKSYNARERLLRGLQDAQKPKIGIGFFRRADEFNAERTRTLLGAEPMAIYMPVDTYFKLADESKAFMTVAQDLLYRPLELFAEDMQSFVSYGVLTAFKKPYQGNTE